VVAKKFVENAINWIINSFKIGDTAVMVN